MANPPKQKGTSFENEVLDEFLRVWPGAHRAEANSESQDLRAVGDWVVECKHRKRWSLFQWIRRIRKRAGLDPWVIVAAHGDRRSSEGREVGTVAVLDFNLFIAMLEVLELGVDIDGPTPHIESPETEERV